MRKCIDYQYVRIHPWIGERYGKGLYKHRILVLGESEYQAEGRKPPSKTDTCWCVKGVIAGTKRSAFFSNITVMFLGQAPQDKNERSRFWHSIAFYNYVQEHVGARAGIRPTKEMWRGEAPAAFREVLAKHKPKYIVVLGFCNWKWLLKADRIGPCISALPPANTKPDDIRQTYWYEVPGKAEALAIAVKHPSRAFDAAEWHKWLKAALPALFDSERKSACQ